MEGREYPLNRAAYEILDSIGSEDGGAAAAAAAAVYRATCKFPDGSSESVVIKKLKNPKSINLVALNHPNVNSVHCSFLDDEGATWMVMGAASASLQSFSAAHPNGLPENIVAAAIKQVCQGLVYLHSLCMFHKDLKPTNVLLFGDAFKVSDTGISSSYYLENSYRDLVDRPYWLPPEKAFSREKDDVYGLGILALELGYGRPPTLIPKASRCSDREAATRFSEQFRLFVTQCLKRNPASRPTAQELLGHPFLNVSCNNAEIAAFWGSIEGIVPAGYSMSCTECDLSVLVKEWVFVDKECKLYPLFIKEGVDEYKPATELQRMYVECGQRLFQSNPKLLGLDEFSELRRIEGNRRSLCGFVGQCLIMFFRQTERAISELEVYLAEPSLDFEDRRLWTRIVCRDKENVDFSKVNEQAILLSNLAGSMGSLKLLYISICLLEHCTDQDVEKCFKYVKFFKNVLKKLKSEIKLFLKLEKRIAATGGVLPDLA